MRLRRVLSTAAVAVAAVAATVSFVPNALADDSPAVTTHYYVALGDSLSRGYMPGTGDTDQGYADDLYATLSAHDPSLQLVKLGCSGETTGSMISGGVCTDRYPDAAHSQLVTAEQFLRAHAGQISYLTLDIGANDVDNCATDGSIDAACVTKGALTLSQNLAKILDGLKAAGAGTAAMKSSGMTYYDPFLASWLTGTKGQLVAVASVGLLELINSAEELLYTVHGFKIVDVGSAFQSLNVLGRQTVAPYGSLPTDVAYICKYTYMCSQQNIHPTVAGYQLIADAFAKRVA